MSRQIRGIRETIRILDYDRYVADLPEPVYEVLRWAEVMVAMHVRYECSSDPEKRRKADLRGVELQVQRRLDEAFSGLSVRSGVVVSCSNAILLLGGEIARTPSTPAGETKIAILAQLEQVWSWIKERAMARR